VIFAYGGTIFVPSGNELTRELLAHELVHCRRQGDDPEAWWDRYLTEVAFRLMEEGLAHAMEYETFCAESHSVRKRSDMLFRISQRLAGPLYGNMCSVAAAKRLVTAKSSNG
jgi:hypothetical protein